MGLVWTARANPLDGGQALAVCWSPEKSKFVAVGVPAGGMVVDQVAMSPDGKNWETGGFPWQANGNGKGICWAAGLSLFVAVGVSITNNRQVQTSPDGETWTNRTNPFNGNGHTNAVAWSASQVLLVACGISSGDVVMTSPDGVAWTAQVTPFDGGGEGKSAVWVESLGLWFVGGYDAAGTSALMSSPDGVVWTLVPCDLDGGQANAVNYAETLGLVMIAGRDATGAVTFATSPDGTTWTPQATPLDGPVGSGNGVLEASDTVVLLGAGPAGATPSIVESPDGVAWEVNASSPFYNGNQAAYSPILDLVVAAGFSGGGEALASASLSSPPQIRFFDGYAWRFVVTNLDLVTMTFLDKLASNRAVALTLNGAAVSTGSVPSDSPEVNIVTGDGDPFLSRSNRFLFGFRREGGTPPWVCRFAGIIQMLDDKADSANQAGDPVTNYTAYDPWQYMFNRPVRIGNGNLPDQNGLVFENVRGSTIAVALLNRTASEDGPTYILIDETDGSIQDTAKIDITFEQGCSVGDALSQLVETGSMDILLDPVYDPTAMDVNIVKLRIMAQAGRDRNGAIFAWDQPSLSLVGIERLSDGSNPDAMANWIQYYNGQGGPKVRNSGGTYPTATDASSITKYGRYVSQQFFPEQTQGAAVRALAETELNLRAAGRLTVTLSPAAQRAPVPLIEYALGDRVPVYASKRFREALEGMQRVYGIPIVISDDGVENIQALLASPQGYTA